MVVRGVTYGPDGGDVVKQKVVVEEAGGDIVVGEGAAEGFCDGVFSNAREAVEHYYAGDDGFEVHFGFVLVTSHIAVGSKC